MCGWQCLIMGEKTKVKLVNFSVLKLSLILLISGFFIGLVSGLVTIIFFQMIMSSFEINLPASGAFVFSFIVVPLFSALSFFLLGLVFGGIFKLSLKIARGLNMAYLEI